MHEGSLSLGRPLADRDPGALARRGPECRALGRPRIYCANHTSHLDALLLLAALPDAQRVRPVAAADYWRRGLRRILAERLFLTVFVDRHSRELNPLEPAFAALRSGDSLIFFPEGTRGAGDALQPFKPGIYYLARAFRQVDIVPVWIGNAHRILPKGSLLPLPALCTVTVGLPLRWDGREDAPAFLARLRDGLERARLAAERAEPLPRNARPAPAPQ